MRRVALAHIVVLCVAMSPSVGCGGRTPVLGSEATGAATAPIEVCNGTDDDGDHKVDETFRDDSARYVNDRNCGECGHACLDPLPHAAAVGCGLVDDNPACVAKHCEPGYGVSRSGRCVALEERLCMPCGSDDECGSLPGARCVGIGGANRCTIGCADGCPAGFTCSIDGTHCEPPGGNCSCDPGEAFSMACALDGQRGTHCPGKQSCVDGNLTECQVDLEICDGVDNDCDGNIDEGFVDERGIYSVDLANCGACGVDCHADVDAGVPLTCGGDPFVPSCVVLCPDSLDGIQLGDHLDADRLVSNGCECEVKWLSDPDDIAASEGALDANCDGADGDVLGSFYVASDGDDSGPGSPSRPLRSLTQAINLAAQSIGSNQPRVDVYVASGTYTEAVQMRDGVRLHGGYRRDFRARNPDGFEVLIVAPATTTAFGGAALVMENVGLTPTLVEGLHVRGFDASAVGKPAIGMVVSSVGPSLVIRDLRVHSGKPGPGVSGDEGNAGAGPTTAADSGEAQRAAQEDSAHACIVGLGNTTHGGAGGKNTCRGSDVSGGAGASVACPSTTAPAASGSAGHGASSASGGRGGTNVVGPIQGGGSCPVGVCCGLADFMVPTYFPQATPGEAGASGNDGMAGEACTNVWGTFFTLDSWVGGNAADGVWGVEGSGGGGGGGGGGAVMNWITGMCEFPDGLGGAGGGGGAGGCGGEAGTAGTSGAPAIGLLIHVDTPAYVPMVSGVTLETEDGAPGGDGGAGGDGAPGGNGGNGGNLPREQLSIPTLAGAAPGERGGHGGHGGAGGAGGGGCGGGSVGIWVTGAGTTQPTLLARLRNANTFVLGDGGAPGRGGGGAVPALAGAKGLAVDVLFR